MSSQRKAKAATSENIVTTETSSLSDLWKKEDWLAVWIGFIIIAVGAVAVITGAFDFNAAKFSTWGHGTSFFEQVNAGFFGKLILTVAVLGVLFTVGNYLKGLSVKKYLPAFLGLFLLAVLVRFISAEYTLNRYLEWSFFFALLAAPTAIAADVPHTEVAVARVMTNGLLSIFKTLVPNHHMKRMTIGVTIHAIPIP